MKRIFLLGCALQAIIATSAQKELIAPDSIYELTPVEVKATRVNEKSPYSVSNITATDIKKQNLGQNLPGLLQQTPSVVVNSDDGTGVGYASIRIRGTDATRINLTINGIPINDPESQGIFFVNFSDLASSVNSVQIQRGVGASTNGVGAFGASINISNLNQSKEAAASIQSAYGSFNTLKNTFRAATGMLKSGFQFDLRLSKINSDGYIDRAFSDLKSLHFISGWTSGNEMTNIKFNLITGKERTGQAWNGVGISFNDKEKPLPYQQLLDKAGRTTNVLGQMPDGTFYKNQTDNYQQDYYQLFVNHKFNNNWTANLGTFLTRGKGYYEEYRPGEKFKSYGLSDLKIKDSLIKKTNLVRQIWLDNYYYGSVFSANYNKKNTDFIFGGAILKYDAKHYGFIKWAEMGVPVDYRWYNLPAHKTDINFFGKIQQQLADGFFAFGDMQIRDVVYKISGFRKNPTVQSDNHYTFFNPKLGLSYILKHDYNASSKLFATYAIANKEPNREDFEASPDNTPRHETLYDVEAGYLYNAINYFLGITGYYMKYNNQLILSGKINDVGAYVRTNVKDSYRAGIELTGSARFTDWITLDANATFSKNKIRNITQFSDDYDYGGQIEQTFSNTDISLSPGAIMGATATFEPFFNKLKTNRFYIDIMEKYVSRQYLDNGMDKLKSINPYSLTDLRLRFEASHKNLKELGIVLLVNNIFNKKYENNGYTFSYKYHGTLTTENYYFPQAGINWNLGITIGF
ncbi:MAG TPA: TonB-dependent receptor plug domain-containing protein [Niabella sp.]|nr:TonB-dependent receptor plug domain-containing protein [Niabella sp.]